MLESKVSIIIPLYNVEKYIGQCIESVLNQNYTNFELIVVNDGSTDSSVVVVEQYAESDSRIELINQQNSGVSAARNNGLKKATGDYVVFIDADDFVAPDFLDYMLTLSMQHDSDFSLSENAFTQTGEKQVTDDITRLLNSEEAVALLLSPRVIVGCWNKIFRRSFLFENNIFFSTTLFYGEGLNFITRAADKANNVCVGNRKVYYYRRNNEASATSSFSIEKMRNGDKALDLIKQQLVSESKEIEEMFALHKGLFALGAITRIINNKKKSDYLYDYKTWMKNLRGYARQLTFSENVSLYRKCMLWAGTFCPSLMAYLDKCRRKRIATNSVH